MDRVSQMRLVRFDYKPEFAEEWGLDENSRPRVGVLAQEVAEILPDAGGQRHPADPERRGADSQRRGYRRR